MSSKITTRALIEQLHIIIHNDLQLMHENQIKNNARLTSDDAKLLDVYQKILMPKPQYGGGRTKENTYKTLNSEYNNVRLLTEEHIESLQILIPEDNIKLTQVEIDVDVKDEDQNEY